MEKARKKRKLPGGLLLVLINAAAGLLLYLFVSDLSLTLDAFLLGKALWLRIAAFAAILAIYIVLALIINRIARWATVDGGSALGFLCGLLAGAAPIAILALNWWRGSYDGTWAGIAYPLVLGFGAFLMGFVSVWSHKR